MKNLLAFGLLIILMGCGVPTTAQNDFDEAIKTEKKLLVLTNVEMDAITEYANTVDEMRGSSPKAEAIFQNHKAVIIAKLETIRTTMHEISSTTEAPNVQ